ncbi:MAG: hypothetical protein ABI747_00965 [Candidatus Moraniibacteriota bacterium]
MFLVSAIAVVSVAVVEKKSAFSTQKSVLAFQAADSGAERVIKRIYINNSPVIGLVLPGVPLNGNMSTAGGDADLNALKGQLTDVAGSPAAACDGVNKKITATNNATPTYTFEITFFDVSGAKIDCSDNQWRDKVAKIKSEGFFRNTSRAIEIGIRPRE